MNGARSPTDLTGKVAVVTGASRGIGAAVVRGLVRRGARTALIGRRKETLSAVGRGCEGVGVALPFPCDLSDPAQAADTMVLVADRLGPVDLIVNNAASPDPLGATAHVPLEEWVAGVQLNLISAALLILTALPGMLERNFGRIVNVTSGAAAGSGMPEASAYSASKAGLEMFTINLAAEVAGTGVSAVAVRPGRVDTDMQLYLRTQSVEVVAARARRFSAEGDLIDPVIPAHLVVRAMELGITGEIISVYDERGRSLLWDFRYPGDGRVT